MQEDTEGVAEPESVATEVIGLLLETAYKGVGSVTKLNAQQVLIAKLTIIKGVSQDLGADRAKSWLAVADPQLGPFAATIVDGLNTKKVAEYVPTVLALIGIAEAASAAS